MPPDDSASRGRPVIERGQVRFVTVDERGQGQRLDNFVLRECPGIPKTRLYRAMRKGEIRVNKGRARPERRLNSGDVVRLPPLGTPARDRAGVAPGQWQERINRAVVYEDDHILALNKPSGLAVHGGSGLEFGLIETVRSMRPQQRFLELVHRLDRETSGLILLAKRPAALKALHALLRDQGAMHKHYLALVAGRWPRHLGLVEAPLERFERASGERIVRVTRDGKPSQTRFRVRQATAAFTLLEAEPLTGRTHQIRVHAQYTAHPILGDSKYFTEESRESARKLGLRRLFLHASRLEFKLEGLPYELQAPLDDELQNVLSKAFN